MTTAKNSLAIALAIILSFAFGWSLQGYVTYKSFFADTVHTATMIEK
jgi:hypothetical protein